VSRWARFPARGWWLISNGDHIRGWKYEHDWAMLAALLPILAVTVPILWLLCKR
jgi:hypothetical protein